RRALDRPLCRHLARTTTLRGPFRPAPRFDTRATDADARAPGDYLGAEGSVDMPCDLAGHDIHSRRFDNRSIFWNRFTMYDESRTVRSREHRRAAERGNH